MQLFVQAVTPFRHASMHPLEEQLCRAWPPKRWADVTVLVAVSGGADSVALLRALLAVRQPGRGRLVAAHLNHQLRGEHSDADAAFVADLCRRLGVECRTESIAVAQTVRGGEGLEAAARRARYQFLAATAAAIGARYVALGHTADDQVETILHRIIRGTGIAGLAGIPQLRALMLPLADSQPAQSSRAGQGVLQLATDIEGNMAEGHAGSIEDLQGQLYGGHSPPGWQPGATLIRPLLSVWRTQIIEYLDLLGQPYRQDQSNLELNYARNKIRRQLLPWLAAELNPAVAQSLLRLGALAAEVQAVIQPIVEKLYSQAVEVHDARRASIDRRVLIGQPRYLVREVLIAVWRCLQWPMQAMGFEQWDALADMLLAPPGSPETTSRTFPGKVQAELDDDRLRLERLQT